MYATDNDGRLPRAETWMNSALTYYLRNPDNLECPAIPHRGSHNKIHGTTGVSVRYSGDYGHAMNRLVGGEKEFKEPERTVLTFCSSNLKRNANDAFVSYTTRFSKGFNVSYVDGHAKFCGSAGAQWLRVSP